MLSLLFDQDMSALTDGLVSSLSNGEGAVTYSAQEIIGFGSFGVVFKAIACETGEVVAIKKVSQDLAIKTREFQILGMLDNINIIGLRNCFHSFGENNELFLNLVMEYEPTTLHRILRDNLINNKSFSMLDIKLYSYQLCRALNYCHTMNVCHRDVKPQNLLVDPETRVLKLCDFGSAKVLVKGEPSVSYVSSRFYRAPELIFGSTDYSNSIDLWSLGCVIAELVLGRPLFSGDNSVAQLVEILKFLGTPTPEDISAMNPHHTNFRFPTLNPVHWTKVFPETTPVEAVDLIYKLLFFNPNKRIKAIEAMAHPFFDELRQPNTKLPNGYHLPPLFNFDEDELIGHEHEICKVLPSHV